MFGFIEELLSDDEYVERQREIIERDMGRIDEELVMHLRIISAIPNEQRPELHRMACRAFVCGCKCHTITEVLYRAVRAQCGITHVDEFVEWCLSRFGDGDGAYIATGGSPAWITRIN